MTRHNRKPNGPGVLLQELFLKPRNITITDFANAADVSRKHISNVIHGRVRVEAELATRFSMVLNTSADVWLNAQKAVDLWEAKQELRNWKPVRYFPASDGVRV